MLPDSLIMFLIALATISVIFPLSLHRVEEGKNQFGVGFFFLNFLVQFF